MHWLFALTFVVTFTFTVITLVLRVDGWRERRDAARRNHARPASLTRRQHDQPHSPRSPWNR